MTDAPDAVLKRRTFLGTLAAATVAATLPRRSEAADPPAGPVTHVYKTVGDCQIKLDVHEPAAANARRPAVMWMHGGGLIDGSRRAVPRDFHAALAAMGYVFISIDYRLVPQTKLPGIIEDLKDAWRWIRAEGPEKLGIDPDRIATAGGSAGGYLTLMSGICLEPLPRCLVSFWGYGELTNPWYAQPSEFYRKQPLVPEDEARKSVGDHVVAEPSPTDKRNRFYLYARQTGAWPVEAAGHDATTDKKWFDPYCPIRNVTPKYPPTMFIHGTDDTDVPYSESKEMADKLAALKVEHELITVQNAGHGLSGAKPEEKAAIAQRAAQWVKAHTA